MQHCYLKYLSLEPDYLNPDLLLVQLELYVFQDYPHNCLVSYTKPCDCLRDTFLTPQTDTSWYGSADERQRYNVTSSLIGWAHTNNDRCDTPRYSDTSCFVFLEPSWYGFRKEQTGQTLLSGLTVMRFDCGNKVLFGTPVYFRIYLCGRGSTVWSIWQILCCWFLASTKQLYEWFILFVWNIHACWVL